VTRQPKLLTRILAHVSLVVLVAIVLYPVMLVCKKAFEPGRDFALSASPIPHDLTLDHFRSLFGSRGSSGEHLFVRQAPPRSSGSSSRAPQRTRYRASGSPDARPA
jgi:ABC-type maltose transport system permease subunit